jgi:transcriptional regulator with XRE-family HTH domain
MFFWKRLLQQIASCRKLCAVAVKRLRGGTRMNRPDRIRIARRRAGFSQDVLARRVGVQRSAVANWESASGSNPSSTNFERLARILDVPYEWLATGRGGMAPPGQGPRPPATTGHGCALEQRLIAGWRQLPRKPREAILELVESYPARAPG